MVSEAIQGAVRGRVAASFVDHGSQDVKNIPYPVRVFAVRKKSGATGTAGAAIETNLPLPEKPSIAVLPFTNMSGDVEQDYFADGMVEDITTALARWGCSSSSRAIPALSTRARRWTSSRLAVIGVRYVLEGSVRRSDNRLRIAGQLIDAQDGHHIWADRFEGTLEDVFDLQDRITESIVSAIEPNVRRRVERVRLKPTANLRAYDLLLRALPGLMPDSTRSEKDESLSFIRRAVDMDPRYALAKAFGAMACMARVVDGFATAEDVKAGLRYAEDALSERTDDPMVLSYAGAALGALGYRVRGVRLLGFRYDEAYRAIDRALQLSPNLLPVQWNAGTVKLIIGESDSALNHFERVMRISPIDPATGAFVIQAGWAHLVSSRYEEALAAAQRVTQENPRFVFGHYLMVIALAHLDRIDEAKLAAQCLLELAPQFTVSRYQSVSPVKDPEYRRRVAEMFLAAGVPK